MKDVMELFNDLSFMTKWPSAFFNAFREILEKHLDQQ